jgi:hypothetical protein
MIASNAALALFLATGYAPLFHLHEAHNDEAAQVHAHLPEAEAEADHDGGRHLETPHPGGAERSIDILTTTAPPLVHFDAVILSSSAPVNSGEVCCGFVTLPSPRAHAPPALWSRTSRAPPA